MENRRISLFRALISACVEKNVSRLVYTSTYNVVYGGEEIINGDESLPYLAEDKVQPYFYQARPHTLVKRRRKRKKGQRPCSKRSTYKI